MVEEWNPNVPDINKEFHKAAGVTNSVEQKNELVTGSMVQKLEAQRDIPLTAPSPTPPGGAVRNIEADRSAIEREQRIKYIRDRMAIAQERMRNGFDKNR